MRLGVRESSLGLLVINALRVTSEDAIRMVSRRRGGGLF